MKQIDTIVVFPPPLDLKILAYFSDVSFQKSVNTMLQVCNILSAFLIFD